MQEGSWTLILNNRQKGSCSAWNEVGVGWEICIIPKGCKPREPKEFILKNPEVDGPATVKSLKIFHSLSWYIVMSYLSAVNGNKAGPIRRNIVIGSRKNHDSSVLVSSGEISTDPSLIHNSVSLGDCSGSYKMPKTHLTICKIQPALTAGCLSQGNYESLA